MKEITILSGKGGAGKTTVVAALASLVKEAVFCDNDVDAADLHLIFEPKIREANKFDSGATAQINPDKCTNCGKCIELCRFEAIHPVDNGLPQVNEFQCEGCRLCERICMAKAIEIQYNFNNNWYVSDTRFGKLVHANMGAGEENSGKLVSKIRERAQEIARKNKAKFIVNDGPPGIGCSAIASVTGTDLVLLVIEPSVSGLHDAKRLIKLVESFQIPLVATINKHNINEGFTEKVETFLDDKNIPILGKIPFTKKMVQSMIEKKSIVEFAPDHAVSKIFQTIWERIVALTKE